MYFGATESRVKARQRIEATIVKRVVKDALTAGFALSVYDGEEKHPATTNVKTLHNQLMETDEDYLFFIKDGEETGWVRFVYGNDGYDVICDYTTNLESVLSGAHKLAESFE